VLHVLPNPPEEVRVRSALRELHELGAIDSLDSPTVLGRACLQVPLDVPFGRLVVFGGILGCCLDAAVLATALCLQSCCEVFRNPRINFENILQDNDLRTFARCVEQRKKFDGGNFSEPLMLWALFFDWVDNENWRPQVGGQPWGLAWEPLVNKRAFAQFTTKVVEVVEGIQRQLPSNDPQHVIFERLFAKLDCSARPLLRRGTYRQQGEFNRWDPIPRANTRKLQALLTWALGPVGWVAVGQTPAIYPTSQYFSTFVEAVHLHGKDAPSRPADDDRLNEAGALTSALRWPSMKPRTAEEVVRHVGIRSFGCWTQAVQNEKGEGDEMFIGNLHHDNMHADRREPSLCAGAELLSRICVPHNGKETKLGDYGQLVVKRAPRHPCTMNWYLPRRTGHGMMEVSVNPKCQADTLLHLPHRRDAIARCRPKRFLIAGGAEYQAQKRVLRGVSVLPNEDGGRTAIMWLFAGGAQREKEFVTYCRPRRGGGCEVRALRIWERTLWLPLDRGLSSSDLRIVNEFRQAVCEMQKRLPHPAAGLWLGPWEDRRTHLHIECISKADQGMSSELLVTDLTTGKKYNLTWDADRRAGAVASRDLSTSTLHYRLDVDSWRSTAKIIWCDGEYERFQWHREERAQDFPNFCNFSQGVVDQMRQAAEKLLEATDSSKERFHCVGDGQGMPGRLIPLELCEPHQVGKGGTEYDNYATPFNLDKLEAKMEQFAAEVERWIADGTWNPEEDEDPHDVQTATDPSDIDLSHENIHTSWMWRLASAPHWSADNVRNTLFVEDALAIPVEPVCSQCEKKGQKFSKSQLARNANDRRCLECTSKDAGGPAPQMAGGSSSYGTSNVAHTGWEGPPVCCICKVELHSENCTKTQKTKARSERKCKTCVQAELAGPSAPEPTEQAPTSTAAPANVAPSPPPPSVPPPPNVPASSVTGETAFWMGSGASNEPPAARSAFAQGEEIEL